MRERERHIWHKSEEIEYSQKVVFNAICCRK